MLRCRGATEGMFAAGKERWWAGTEEEIQTTTVALHFTHWQSTDFAKRLGMSKASPRSSPIDYQLYMAQNSLRQISATQFNKQDQSRFVGRIQSRFSLGLQVSISS